MSKTNSVRDHVVLLVGGVGGAKLALGLSILLPADGLTIVVNTADDFEHLGLHISPDLDSVMYALAGLANPATGWGIADDTFQALDMVARYGGPDWFRLGDRDLGTSLMRTVQLREGKTLTEATRSLCGALGIKHDILPMSDQPVRTWVDTEQGDLPFQEYFVKKRWQPAARKIRFQGANAAKTTEQIVKALDEATLVVLGPSNPLVSIAPILSVNGMRDQIKNLDTPCVALSPIIGGKAVKGPAAKLMTELGHDVSPLGIAQYYKDFLDGIIFDDEDAHLAPEIEKLNIKTFVQKTLMTTLSEKIDLATAILTWSEENLL